MGVTGSPLPTSPERASAKWEDMLAVDERYALRWVATMRELVDRANREQMPDLDFTIARMAALSDWKRQRVQAQQRIHYRYDPRRRNPALIEADIAKQEVRLRERMEHVVTFDLPPRDHDEPDHVVDSDEKVTVPGKTSSTLAERAARLSLKPAPTPIPLSADLRAELREKTGITNFTTATTPAEFRDGLNARGYTRADGLALYKAIDEYVNPPEAI